MRQFRVTVMHKDGLHARPARLFVKTASASSSKARIPNAVLNRNLVDAKSALGVLTLGVEPNYEIEVELEGLDEIEAASSLQNLVSSDFESSPSPG